MRLDTIVAIGARAADLVRHGAEARVLAPLTGSIYIAVRGQVLWLGGPDDLLHPRAILLATAPAADGCAPGERCWLPPCAVPAWRPDPAPDSARAAEALRSGAAGLAARVAVLGPPAGFGSHLVGAPLAFPLADATARVDALAAACAQDVPQRAADAAGALLGLGSGLTPSGDDFVGGAFFARALLARAGACDAAAWRRAADAVRERAPRATHPISAALLGDLLDGEGWAPVHELARALASEDEPAALAAARRLVGLGHSSGWDLLAGFVAGAAR